MIDTCFKFACLKFKGREEEEIFDESALNLVSIHEVKILNVCGFQHVSSRISGVAYMEKQNTEYMYVYVP